MTIIRFGIDLAKNSFAICGVDMHGKIVLRKTLKREKLLEFRRLARRLLLVSIRLAHIAK